MHNEMFHEHDPWDINRHVAVRHTERLLRLGQTPK